MDGWRAVPQGARGHARPGGVVSGPCSLAGAFAADALDPLEARRFAAHLKTCAACRADTRELRAAAAALGAMAEEAPPPHLRACLLAAARATPQDPPVAAAAAPASRLRAARAVAAGVAAAVVLAGAVLVPGAGPIPELASRPAAVEGLVAAPGARVVALRGAGGLSARLVVGNDGSVGLVADALPAVGVDRAYELWLIEPGGNRPPRALGLFRPDALGRVRVVADGPLPRSRDPAEGLGAPRGGYAVGVTVEPRAGSPRPTGQPVLYGLL